MNEDFGDRMKLYENEEADRRFMPLLPICARLDGKCFSKFTKGLEKPYEEKLSKLMIDVTKTLVEETNAYIGYTQSDEISLVWYSDDFKSQVWFDGRIAKMTSVLASMCTAFFNHLILQRFMPMFKDRLAFFDCRVWQVPTLDEAANTILWREQDATKNAISCAAQQFYSHNQLQSKNGKEMQEMLFQKGINFNDYPAFFKRGTFVQRKKVVRKFTVDELDKLPEKHEARKNPDLMIERSDIFVVDMPKFSSVVNRVGVIFHGEDPRTEHKVCEPCPESCGTDKPEECRIVKELK